MNLKTVINKILKKSISIPYCLIKRAKRDGVDFFMTEACTIAENSRYQLAYRKYLKSMMKYLCSITRQIYRMRLSCKDL